MELRQRGAAGAAGDRSVGQETPGLVHTLLLQVGLCVVHSRVLRVLASEFYRASFWGRDEIGGASLLIPQRGHLGKIVERWRIGNALLQCMLGLTSLRDHIQNVARNSSLWWRAFACSG